MRMLHVRSRSAASPGCRGGGEGEDEGGGDDGSGGDDGCGGCGEGGDDGEGGAKGRDGGGDGGECGRGGKRRTARSAICRASSETLSAGVRVCEAI